MVLSSWNPGFQNLQLPVAIQVLFLVPVAGVLFTTTLYFVVYDPLGIISFLLDVSLYFLLK